MSLRGLPVLTASTLIWKRKFLGDGGGNLGASSSKSLALNPLAVLPHPSSHTSSYFTFLKALIQNLPWGLWGPVR